MNIEVERKAFEVLAYPNAKSLNFVDGKYKPFRENQSIWSQKVADHANNLFPVWLAAKEHAKTPVTIYSLDTSDVWTHDGTQYSFATKEEAIEDAVFKGYRVIEE